MVPHKDFFTAQFLVSLGAGSAQATVTVSAAVIDQTDCVWQTGPKTTLTVKQHDDPTARTHWQQLNSVSNLFIWIKLRII